MAGPPAFLRIATQPRAFQRPGHAGDEAPLTIGGALLLSLLGVFDAVSTGTTRKDQFDFSEDMGTVVLPRSMGSPPVRTALGAPRKGFR
jgi:hypothetical protein